VKEKDFIISMKMRNFVEDLKGWTRRFTFIKFDNGQIFIGHRIKGINTKMTKIEFEHIDEWIKYFDRI